MLLLSIRLQPIRAQRVHGGAEDWALESSEGKGGMLGGERKKERGSERWGKREEGEIGRGKVRENEGKGESILTVRGVKGLGRFCSLKQLLEETSFLFCFLLTPFLLFALAKTCIKMSFEMFSLWVYIKNIYFVCERETFFSRLSFSSCTAFL